MSNAEQIDYWNGKVGDIWGQMQERMDLALTPVTAALLAAASPQPGELVLDIGCGAGETTPPATAPAKSARATSRRRLASKAASLVPFCCRVRA